MYICCPIPVYAAERESYLTGTTDERTTLRDPGESESQDELRELNIGNTFAITYNDGNGQVNGTLRILITLTLIAIAPTLIIMLTSFTRIYYCSAFYEGSFEYPNSASKPGTDWVSFVFNLFHHAAHADAGL